MKQFAIYEANFERLEKKINRIRTKCEKYGCGFHFEVVGEEFRELFDEESNTKYTGRFILVEAEGTAVINGWKFVATIDRTEAGNIIRNNTDIEIPERYFDCELTCEHCHSQRHRKNTYLVYNEDTKEFKQVGSSCLCDYTGGLSAEGVAGYIEMFDELIQGESTQGCHHITRYYELDEVLIFAKEFVRHLGYRSSSYSEYGTRTTRDCVNIKIDQLEGRLSKYDREFIEDFEDQFHPVWDRPEDKAFIEEMKNYIRNLDERNDAYVHNLKVLSNATHVDRKNFGYVVSMIPFYTKQVEIEVRNRENKQRKNLEAEKSSYIGKIKDRIEFKVAYCSLLCSRETEWGFSFLYKFVDEDYNVYMWSSSVAINEDADIVSVKGTVKDFQEYNGVKQTWITRCKVAYNEDQAESERDSA